MGNLQWAINNLQLAECHPGLVEGSNVQLAKGNWQRWINFNVCK